MAVDDGSEISRDKATTSTSTSKPLEGDHEQIELVGTRMMEDHLPSRHTILVGGETNETTKQTARQSSI